MYALPNVLCDKHLRAKRALLKRSGTALTDYPFSSATLITRQGFQVLSQQQVQQQQFYL